MRLGLLADVHSNLHALRAVLEDADTQGIDQWAFLGDAVGYNASPSECIRLLRSLDAACVRGNHDEAVLTGEMEFFRSVARAGVEYSRKVLAEEDLAWLSALPEEAAVTAGRSRVHLVHGSPRDPLREYIFPEESDSLFEALLLDPSVQPARTLVLGHTHMPLDRPCRSGRVVNPGSVGQPRDADARAAWAYLDLREDGTDPRPVFRRVPYDVEGAQDAIRHAGLPEMLAVRLGQGI